MSSGYTANTDATLCGMIHAVSEDTIKVIFTSPRIAKRYGVEITRGEEAGLVQRVYEGKKWLEAISAYRERPAGLRALTPPKTRPQTGSE